HDARRTARLCAPHGSDDLHDRHRRSDARPPARSGARPAGGRDGRTELPNLRPQSPGADLRVDRSGTALAVPAGLPVRRRRRGGVPPPRGSGATTGDGRPRPGRVLPVTGAAAPRLVLASASPRRRELLARLGRPFEVRPTEADETPRPGETPDALVVRLALDKARGAARPGEVALGADTVVALGGSVLGKPADDAEA